MCTIHSIHFDLDKLVTKNFDTIIFPSPMMYLIAATKGCIANNRNMSLSLNPCFCVVCILCVVVCFFDTGT